MQADDPHTDSNYVAGDHAKGNVELRLGSTTGKDFKLKPYGNHGDKALMLPLVMSIMVSFLMQEASIILNI